MVLIPQKWGAERVCVRNKQRLEGEEIGAGSEVGKNKGPGGMKEGWAYKDPTVGNPDGRDIPGPLKIVVS